MRQEMGMVRGCCTEPTAVLAVKEPHDQEEAPELGAVCGSLLALCCSSAVVSVARFILGCGPGRVIRPCVCVCVSQCKHTS